MQIFLSEAIKKVNNIWHDIMVFWDLSVSRTSNLQKDSLSLISHWFPIYHATTSRFEFLVFLTHKLTFETQMKHLHLFDAISLTTAEEYHEIEQ